MVESQDTPSVEEYFSKKDTPITLESPTDLLVIPDVHGDMQALQYSLDSGMEFFAKQSKSPEIIFLGDLIDRGPDSAQVLKHIMDLIKDGVNVTILIGNHEAMFIECLYDPGTHVYAQWIYNGGLETLSSFNYLFDSKINEFISDLSALKPQFSFSEFYKFCLLHTPEFMNISKILREDPLIHSFVNSLDLCIRRSSDLFVHAGFVPDFISSEYNLDNWIFGLQTSFKHSLFNKMVSLENDFERFRSTSVARGGKSIAGPLWADYSDFHMSSFESALLTTLMQNQSVNRMIVGHNIVMHPHDIAISVLPNKKLDILFLDIGMSAHYDTEYSAMNMCIGSDGQEMILNSRKKLIPFL